MNILVTVIAIVLTVLLLGNETGTIDTFDTAFDGLGRLIATGVVWVIAFACYAAISKHYSSKSQ
jgi:hypothetical protein